MFLAAKPVVKDRTLSFQGNDLLTGLHENVVVTPLKDTCGLFLGATSTENKSRHVFKLGVIQ